MSPLRVGVTGSGFMGRTHVDAVARLDSTEPVAVTGGSRAEKLARDYGITAEPDLASLLSRGDVDAVIISTPHWLHCEEALACAEAGVHVLVEKPMATSIEDCDRMTAAFNEKGLVLSLGYHQRFRDSNRTARRLVKDGAIGKVRCIQTSALFDIAAMRSDPGFGGGWGWWTDPRAVAHLINSAPHTIDLCRWCLDADLVSVAAQSGTFREENPNENTTMALLSFSDGTMASFWSSSVCPAPVFSGEEFRFRIMGDEGIIDLDPYARVQLGKSGEWTTVYEQPPVGHTDAGSAFGMNRMQAYCDQVQAFVNSINGKRGGEGTPDDGRAGVAAVLAMLASAESGQSQSL